MFMFKNNELHDWLIDQGNHFRAQTEDEKVDIAEEKYLREKKHYFEHWAWSFVPTLINALLYVLILVAMFSTKALLALIAPVSLCLFLFFLIDRFNLHYKNN